MRLVEIWSLAAPHCDAGSGMMAALKRVRDDHEDHVPLVTAYLLDNSAESGGPAPSSNTGNAPRLGVIVRILKNGNSLGIEKNLRNGDADMCLYPNGASTGS